VQGLPDYLAPGLVLVFVGMNPGLASARKGHYYAGPGNLFWPALHHAGLTPRLLHPEEDFLLPTFGIGITDVVPRPSRSIAELRSEEWRVGAEALEARLAPVQARMVCFNGLSGLRAVLGPAAGPGLQAATLARARVFAVPSTSRRNASYPREAVFEWFRRLRALLDEAGPEYAEG
jgi:TDG/mug DNA glycosylase family protein